MKILMYNYNVNGRGRECNTCNETYERSPDQRRNSLKSGGQNRYKILFRSCYWYHSFSYAVSISDHMMSFCIYIQFSQLGMKYLCIPGPSVPSERLSSKAGELVSARRSRLKPEHVTTFLF